MIHYKLVACVGRLHSSTPIPPVGIEFDSKTAADKALAFVQEKGFDAIVIKDDEDADTASEDEGGDGGEPKVEKAA
jgi:hypothetical protein